MSATQEFGLTQEQMEVSGRAFQLQMENRPEVPQPKDVIPMCVPMKFKKFSGGGFKIKNVTQVTFPVATMRHSIMFGVKPLTLDFQKPTTFHKLVDKEGSTLTSDQPIEVYSQYIEFHKAHGNVLVSGLGLGMAATMIANLPQVNWVTVVEKEKKIIELVERQLPDNVNVIDEDISNIWT